MAVRLKTLTSRRFAHAQLKEVHGATQHLLLLAKGARELGTGSRGVLKGRQGAPLHCFAKL